MTFSYNPSLPNPPNDPADDVPGMQVNSASIAGLVSTDHVGFNVAGGGQHKQVTFNSNNVPAVFPVTPPVLFTDVVAGLPQLKFFSGDAAHSSNQYIVAGSGSTMLLGGIIIKWGAYTILAGNSFVNVTFASAFPNNVFSIVLTNTVSATVGDLTGNYNTATVTGFKANRQGSPGTNAVYTYIAIGN